MPRVSGSGLAAYVRDNFKSNLSFDDLDWLCDCTRLPVVVKGVCRGDDARRAAEHGAKALIVSNHGGRQLDTAPATSEVLPHVVEAAGDLCEIYVDGGIRRGSDVLKAIALGARAVLVGLIDQGAREIRLVNRTPARAAKLTQELHGPIKPLDWAQRHAALDGAAMLINTTNQGMVGEPPLDLALDPLPANALICDIIYIPRETPLLAAARKRGNPTMNGLGMLIHQARPAFQAWFGIMPEATPELRAMIEANT